MTEPLLQAQSLRKYFVERSGVFHQHRRYLRAVDDIDLTVFRGETLGLVGESGCGKSTLGKTLLRLHEPDAGRVWFGNTELTRLPRASMRRMRRHIQMIFQDPYDSLNSRHTIGDIIEEPLLVHRVGTPAQRRERVLELCEQVGLPRNSLARYPHEFSGGQRQRVGIARAIALEPEFVVCDEPVSALDVSIQAQIINLLLQLRERLSLSMLFISHDLSVVRHLSDRVAVMYLGRLVEVAPAADLYERARHPYTRYLISAIPRPEPGPPEPLRVLDAELPSPLDPPSGCRFHPRCPLADERCSREEPVLEPIDAERRHLVACHHWRRVGS